MNIDELKQKFSQIQTINKNHTQIAVKDFVILKRLIQQHDLFCCYYTLHPDLWKAFMKSNDVVEYRDNGLIVGRLNGVSIILDAKLPKNVILAFGYLKDYGYIETVRIMDYFKGLRNKWTKEAAMLILTPMDILEEPEA